MSQSKAAKKTGCPICRQPSSERHAPFCSRRCAEIDLGRWLKGSYAIATDQQPSETDGDEAE